MKNNVQQGSRTIRGMKSLMLIYVPGLLLVSGCMSARVTTNLKPETNAQLTSPAGKFYVTGLKYTNGDSPDNKKTDAHVLKLVRKECSSRYPALFGSYASGSIPLAVEVDSTTTTHGDKMFLFGLCTGFLCPYIFPAPDQFEEDIDVRAGLWNGRDGMRGAPLQASFQRENHCWRSMLTPSALITIPGKSDFPKESNMFTEGVNYPQISQQVATALAQLVAAKEAGFWVLPVGSESSPAALPSAPTTTLPAPADSTAPF
jgi:hypothetical protein